MIRDVATKLGRKLDEDGEADAFIQRQDGWALGAKGVTSLMVGGSFSDMALLQQFLESDYHGPADEFSDKVPLGGAAEEAEAGALDHQIRGRVAHLGREGRVVGVVGVIGPTRLNYARVVPMVDFTAQSLGKLIGQDGFSRK